MTLQASCTEIIRSIAEKHGIQAADLTGPSRSKQLWAARREAVVAMREAKVSIGRIAYALKRGKTTIAYYLNPAQDCARSKKSYAAKNGKSVRLNLCARPRLCRKPEDRAGYGGERTAPQRARCSMSDPFADLQRGHYGAIYADPPWRFATWNKATAVKRRSSGTNVGAATHYDTMRSQDIAALPVGDLAARDCCLFLWISWPMLPDAMNLISAWGFEYKTCAFDWMKAHTQQIDIFRDDADPLMGMGYWTRANTEPCLLATKGKPKRLHADVRQGVLEPRREHSRKPDCVHGRIERLVAGPYLELFARAPRTGWDVWGNQTDKFAEAAE